MEISQPNNAVGQTDAPRKFGIRVGVPPGDPIVGRLVGEDWQTFHWFESRAERDRALRDMAARHRFSRIGDAPTIVLEAIER